ncbi:hypothetical protein OS190_12565 [Sulfitobacter sp. F26204]|uniref:hypothetical protein n=1 Tax=Sulfitobacter sp. F26204 TaxID=2996014 RepID=UPI00225DFE1A|nr:hypothetical protein [Sulfitobacter sp. F26204]MCX7560403.1 hypothetical protein [Sulfitobacter sp. F26204]
MVSDITSGNEYIKIDNVSVTATQEVPEDGTTETVETVLLCEDFNDVSDPDDSAAIESDGGWDVQGGAARTDGCNDGILKTAAVETDGNATFSFDASVDNACNFESWGWAADCMTLQVRIDEDNWKTLDTFKVNHGKTALVGNQTGNEITEGGSNLSYSGGVLDDVKGDLQFRFVSDFTSSNEVVRIDNIKLTETSEEVVDTPDGDCEGGQYDVGYIAGVPVLKPVSEDQLKTLDEEVEDLLDDVIV